jgi:hypothetical protein
MGMARRATVPTDSSGSPLDRAYAVRVPKRLARILRRLLFVALALLVVGLAGFTWFAFWPLEGSVGSIDRLIPETVDFAYKVSWPDLRAQAWVRQNLLEGSVFPDVATARDQFEKETLDRVHQELEGPINDMIPLHITHWSLADDIFGRETVACGRFCEEWGPERGRPLQPREWVVLTRISWKSRFVAALKHGFIREQVGPGVTIDPDDEPDVYRIVLRGIPVSDPHSREGCGGGFVIPPENLLYLTRVKDVLAIGNSKLLIRDVAELGKSDESGRSLADARGFHFQPPPGGMAAAIDVGPLRKYLVRLLESGDSAARLLGRFVTVQALDRLNGTLQFPSADVALGKADISYDRSDLAPAVESVFSLSPEPVGEQGLARLVPADDTFAVLFLRSPPEHVMRAIWEEALAPGDRNLVLDNMRRQGKYQTIDQFIGELATKVGDTAAIAIARLSDPFDHVEYPTWYPDPNTDPPAPTPGVAIWVRLRQSVEPKEVDDFLADRFVSLGFKSGVERKTYRGISYARLEIEQKSADFQLATPGYLLVQDHLILSTNESYLRKIIDTLQGAPALAAEPTFRATMSKLEERANVAVFVDLAKLFRIPPSAAKGGQPRGWEWDGRNLWVSTHKDANVEATRYRNELYQKFWKARVSPTAQQKADIDRQVDEHYDTWMAHYPDFLEEYRRQLEGYARLRSAGLTFTATRDVLAGRFVLLLQPADGSGEPPADAPPTR